MNLARARGCSTLRFTPDGKQLVTGTLNCTILFWDWTKKP
jgi:hypothetical protein